MRDVFIHKTARTAHGKRGGVFRHVDAVGLSAAVIKHFDGEEVDEIIWGCTQQYARQGYNVARQASLNAGRPHSLPAYTVNRLCGSSMSALHSAYSHCLAGLGSSYIVGGVEHMTHNPMTEHYLAPKGMGGSMAMGSAMMGLTAEMVAKLNTVSRKRQDEFALRSHQLANKHMKEDINVFVTGHAPSSGGLYVVERDEGVRPDANIEALEDLNGAFDPNGSVTAGNSSGIADGASAVMVSTNSDGARARIRSVGVSAGDPSTMGIQPVHAVQNALERAGLTIGDVGCWEINEAFAAQSVAVVDTLGIDPLQVNLAGGSIAIGHPLGSSGTRIIHTLLTNMEKNDIEVGVATMCVGMGQGVATVVERV